MEFKTVTHTDFISEGTIVRVNGDGKLGYVKGRSQKYFALYLVHVQGEKKSRILSAESMQVLVQ